MDEYDFEDYARHILTAILNAAIQLWRMLKKVAAYLKANFGNPRDDDTSPGKNSVGRPRKGELPKDLPLVVAVYGDREAEIRLRRQLADECGFDKNTAKARIAETREALADAEKEHLAKLMADNGLGSLIRKLDAQ